LKFEKQVFFFCFFCLRHFVFSCFFGKGCMSGRKVWKRGVEAGVNTSQPQSDVQVSTSIQDAVLAFVTLNASPAVLAAAKQAQRVAQPETLPIRHPSQGVGATIKKKDHNERTKAQKMMLKPSLGVNNASKNDEGGKWGHKARGSKRRRKEKSSSEEEHDVGKSGSVK
jgi:hypothetical protein